ncbi:sterol desaturase family protein [Desertimonas flava]|jgi:sterol desaturase/sphingolipid hydroxylase (fatty acid hydroxylase superfamily)|uniref:sterol desaturase family protein n=1 Tax=Desertimonas flava TaxID=2064846 RepID=UPI001968E6B8|nr:sterol desaturase family protein [Desertimonas flava]
MDLTVAAVPGYFATMGAEHVVLRRRAARNGPSPVDYERNDTRASLTMGVLSLVVPMATKAAMERIAPQRSRAGRALGGLAVGAAALTAAADGVRSRRRDRVDQMDRAARMADAIARVAGPVAVASGAIAACSAWASATSPEKLWSRRLGDLGTGATASALAVAGWDFIYYWNHRFMHECRALWAIHVVHHSSQRYNLSTALRQPVADSFGMFVPMGLLCLAGIRPRLVEFARGVNLLYQYWIHTDTIGRLGPIEEVFNTASHHRVHHGSNGRYIDRNHGSILITWDRLFGTFQREDEPVVYGLTKNIGTYNPWRIATHEHAGILADVRDARNWRDRLSFVLRGPGWAYRRHALAAAAA